MDLPAQLNRQVARELLADPETQAFACLVAACALLDEEVITDEDGQPPDEQELLLMLEGEQCHPHRESLTRIVGLLMATSGDEFNEDPVHFHRMCSAISDGDPFGREDDGDPLTLPDIYWAIYQTGLVIDEDEPLDELQPRVRKFLDELVEDEAEDVEELAKAILEEGGAAEDSEPYYKRLLVFRRQLLAEDLFRLGCKPDWMTTLDPELAGIMESLA